MTAAAVTAAAPPAAKPEDKWIARSLEAVAPRADVPAGLTRLQDACRAAAGTLRLPTTRNEEYRFTDLSGLSAAALAPPSPAPDAAVVAALEAHGLKDAAAATVVVVDGVVSRQHSSTPALPAGAYVGSLAGAPAGVVASALGAQSRARGGPFATLNGCVARDAVVVHVPAGATVAQPIHILYLSSGTAASSGAEAAPLPASAPRLLLVLEEGSMAEVVEEYASLEEAAAAVSSSSDGAGGAGGEARSAPPAYFCNSVAEVDLDDGANLKHCLVQLQGRGAFHARATLVAQGAESSYSLAEVALGGRLARHDLGVEQLGEATRSTMRSFLVCGEGQLQDLHSKLRLDHPSGEANQLHNRNLLLVPRATVNVKPNLQIVADDVKCTHGCAVSDLDEEETFYLRSRGLSVEVARQLLVHSFGGEVVQDLRDEQLLKRVERAVRATLDRAAASSGAELASASS
eukprot:scaffold1.g5803.t1